MVGGALQRAKALLRSSDIESTGLLQLQMPLYVQFLLLLLLLDNLHFYLASIIPSIQGKYKAGELGDSFPG